MIGTKILKHVPSNRSAVGCHMCKASRLRSVLDLGHQPHSDDFLSKERLNEVEHKYPLRLVQCTKCGLLQLDYFVSPEILYAINYTYVSSTTKRGVGHYHEMAGSVIKKLDPTGQAFVIDVGSNVGVLLQAFKDLGCKVLGVDPARDVALVAQKNKIPTVIDFFSEKVAKHIVKEQGRVDVITGTNVFAHLHDIDSAVRGMKLLLKKTGIIAIEAPSALELVKHLEYDTIYHQHIGYLSVKPMRSYFARFGLELFDVEEVSIHGGSLRYFVGHKGEHSVAPAVHAHVAREESFGLYDKERLDRFAKEVAQQKLDLQHLLLDLKRKGKTVVALSAPAKGNTLLNYCHLDTSIIDFATERNLLKVGLVTPGMHIPIKTDRELLRMKPDYALILAWNFAEEIMANNAQFKKNGGRFIIPIPKPVIV